MGNVLVARTYILDYFSVVVNKSSRLSVVDYQITKIDGFFRGVREWGEASTRQASEVDDEGELSKQTLGWW